MIISLKLDGGKQCNPKIRALLDKKLRSQIRPRMSERRKPKPKKEIKTSYCIKTKNIASIFLNWLEKNAHKFGFKPYVHSVNEDDVEIFFDGIAPEIISAQLYWRDEGYAGFGVEAKNNGVFCDWLLDFDVILMRDHNGYYCDFCTPREYFEDEEALVTQHLLAGSLRWCNENLDRAKGVYFHGSLEEGFSSARLVLTDKDLDETKKDRYISFR